LIDVILTGMGALAGRRRRRRTRKARAQVSAQRTAAEERARAEGRTLAPQSKKARRKAVRRARKGIRKKERVERKDTRKRKKETRQLGRQRRRGGSPVGDETSTILQQAEAADAGGGEASTAQASALTLPDGPLAPVGAGDVETRKPSPIPFIVAGVVAVGAILWWRRRKKKGHR
jgi:hypothetical protein